jgi:acyl-CoA reductase-like NAD-dependent aldehyde dehydrogenase
MLEDASPVTTTAPSRSAVMTELLTPAGVTLLPEVERFLERSHQLYIGGAFVDAASRRTFATYDPATGRKLTDVAHAEVTDVDRAVEAARVAYDGPWSRMKAAERERLIWRVGDFITKRAEVFGQIEALDNGKSAMIAQHVDAGWAADVFRYYAGWATKIQGSTVNVTMPFAPGREFHAYTLWESVGVCGAIVPWNFPLLMASWKNSSGHSPRSPRCRTSRLQSTWPTTARWA